MKRRSFFGFLAGLPLGWLFGAVRSEASPRLSAEEAYRRQTAALDAPGLLPGRVDLLLRMGRIHALRKALDAAHDESERIFDKHHPGNIADTLPTFHADWLAEAEPVNSRIAALAIALEDLERESLDTVLGDPEIRPGGALWALRADARHIETRTFREDELVQFSEVKIG